VIDEPGWFDPLSAGDPIWHSCFVGALVYSIGGLVGAGVFGAYLAGMSWLGYPTTTATHRCEWRADGVVHCAGPGTQAAAAQ
jgi:hypothetical protein